MTDRTASTNHDSIAELRGAYSRQELSDAASWSASSEILDLTSIDGYDVTVDMTGVPRAAADMWRDALERIELADEEAAR